MVLRINPDKHKNEFKIIRALCGGTGSEIISNLKELTFTEARIILSKKPNEVYKTLSYLEAIGILKKTKTKRNSIKYKVRKIPHIPKIKNKTSEDVDKILDNTWLVEHFRMTLITRYQELYKKWAKEAGIIKKPMVLTKGESGQFYRYVWKNGGKTAWSTLAEMAEEKKRKRDRCRRKHNREKKKKSNHRKT